MKHHPSFIGIPMLILAGSLIAQLVCADPLPNAWQITDNTSSAITGSYSTNLPPAQQSDALTEGWRYSIHARFVNDFNGTATMVFLYGVGTNRFSVFLDLDSNGDLTATPFNQPPITLTTNGTGAALYHTYEIVYSPTDRQATFLFDGIQRTTWSGDGVNASNGLVTWGAGSTSGQGRMNFHAITFAIGTNVVAAYDAGTQSNPTNSPDPRAQNWIASLTMGNTNFISPDTVPKPAVPVVMALGTTTLEPSQVLVSGLINQGGLGASAWFEWGATTGYGNATAPQFLKADTNAVNFSQTLVGLAKGVGYHFRCAASNALGVVYSEDATFTTPLAFVVTSLANSGKGSLRQTISDAVSGDTITFDTTGTLVLTTGQLDITKNLEIVGPGPANLRIDADGDSRVFRITAGAIATISGITITNGRAPEGSAGLSGFDGGGIHNAGTLTLSNCVITRNWAGHGGIGSSPESSDGGFGGAGGDGGGIYNVGFLTLLGCNVTNNSAGYGGNGGDGAAGPVIGGYNGGPGGNGGRGGGIFSSTAFTCVNSVVSFNTSGIGGAGGDGGDTSNPLANPGDGGDGGNGGSGGGAYLEGTSTWSNCIQQTNMAHFASFPGRGGAGTGGETGSDGEPGVRGQGGGICNAANSTFNGCVLEGNFASSGGGILAYSGTLTLNDCTLDDNRAESIGGGIYVLSPPASVIIRRSTVSSNEALFGGGIQNFGILRIENSTVVLNLARRAGGGIYNDVGSSLPIVSLNNCTLVGNTASPSGPNGGAIFNAAPTAIALTNSIITQNFPPNVGSLIGANNIASGNPQLAAFALYGGTTRTMPPLPGSSAVDAGANSVTNFLATDQRGYRRRSGAYVDVGAVEVQVGDANNPPVITQAEFLSDGAVRVTFTNDPAITFSVYASTNVAAPLNQWLQLGSATQPSSGIYQLTDSTATNYPQRFYKVVWP